MTRPAHRYAALLRGINVGGHGVITMAELREVFESLGTEEVSTYIQSGNVLFTDTEGDRGRLTRRLEEGVGAALGRPVTVFVLTRHELEDAAAHNPFEPAAHAATRQCHLVFLSAEPAAERRAALMGMQGDEYLFHVRGKVLYLAYDRAVAGRRRNVDFERVLGVTGTARTWKVVDRLVQLLG